MKFLNIQYLKASHSVYLSAKENITSFLNQILSKGFKNILLYGAGEVAELLLNVINSDNENSLNVIAIIDDDVSKHNTYLQNHKIVSSTIIHKIKFDGILISNYSHRETIYDKLMFLGQEKEKVLMFFEI